MNLLAMFGWWASKVYQMINKVFESPSDLIVDCFKDTWRLGLVQGERCRPVSCCATMWSRTSIPSPGHGGQRESLQNWAEVPGPHGSVP